MKIRITFTEEVLGTKAANADLFADFIASKAPDGDRRREEIETAEHREESGTTVFHRDPDGTPILWDYQVKGFFKDACGALRRADGTRSKDLKAYKTTIDSVVFPKPRRIRLILPEGVSVGLCERPLRADTAQGPRVSLCRSETLPAGTYFDVEIATLAESVKPLIREWLDYGALRGIGQWRNSGKGRFEWQELE
jgi:hypothetical protein